MNDIEEIKKSQEAKEEDDDLRKCREYFDLTRMQEADVLRMSMKYVDMVGTQFVFFEFLLAASLILAKNQGYLLSYQEEESSYFEEFDVVDDVLEHFECGILKLSFLHIYGYMRRNILPIIHLQSGEITDFIDDFWEELDDPNFTVNAKRFWAWLEQLNLQGCEPSMVNYNALLIYLRGLKRGVITEKNTNEFLSGAIYTAFKMYKIQILKALSTRTGISIPIIVEKYRIIIDKIWPIRNHRIRDTHPIRYVNDFIDEFDLSKNIENRAKEKLKCVTEYKIRGKDPRRYAAAAVYIVAKHTDEAKTLKEIACSCDTTEVAMRVIVKELYSICHL